MPTDFSINNFLHFCFSSSTSSSLYITIEVLSYCLFLLVVLIVYRCREVLFLWLLRLVYFCFTHFRPYAFVEAAALRSKCPSIRRRHPIATRFSFFFSFFPLFVYLFGDRRFFPSISCTIAAFSLNGEYVVRSFFPCGLCCVFLPCDHGLVFYISLLLIVVVDSHIQRIVLVCVCVFFPSILDIKFVGRTSRGHTGGRSHRIFNPPSFCGACLDFCREKDSAIPFPRRP